jgi:TP901-1 family phage major tail protein
MEKPIKGKDKVLMFRLFKDRAKTNATRLALQTTHTIKESSKTDSTPTKDGSSASSGELETTIDIEALASDTLTNDMLHYAVKNQLELEVWEINFTKPEVDEAGKETGKYMSQYGTGYLSDWESPADVDGNTTIKTSMTVSGQLVKGQATVSKLDAATVHNFFRDTTPDPEEVDPLPDYKMPEPAEAKTETSSETPNTDGVTE